MGKEKFIDELKYKLNYLSEEEISKVVTYYSEIIDDKIEDGMTEEDAVSSLGSMEEIEEIIRTEAGNYKKENNFQSERKIYTCKNDVELIHVDDKNTSIEINPTSKDKIFIEYYEDKYSEYDILENEDTVFIKKMTYPHFMFFGGLLHLANTKMVINIPLKSMVKKLDISTTNAYINCIDLNVPRIELKSSNGKMNIENIEALKGIKIYTTNGVLNITNLKSGNMVECHTTNGAIVLQDVETGDGIELKTTNGAVKINSAASKNLTVKTSNGSIKFDGVEVNENIDLKSTNSSIKGRIIGLMTEFNIISKTINGKNNLPSSLKLGDKNLTAVTSNGSINIEFGGRTLK